MSRPSQVEEASAAAAAAAEEEERSAAADDDKPVVLLLRPLFPELAAAINPRYRLIQPWESPLPLPSFLALHAAEIRAILCSGPSPVSAEVVAALPNLELVVATSAGVNHIDLAACRRRGVRVTNAGAVFSSNVADFAVGLAVAALRRIPAADRFVRSGSWPLKGSYPLASKVSGKQVGIVGLGSIGSEIAKRLEAFGCTIMYNSRSRKPSVTYKYFPNVHDLAVESNILILACALTPQTHHIINRDVLLALGADGVLINVGRGALVDEKELVKCLVEGTLGGAGLDVFENEPTVPNELFQMDNVARTHEEASSCILREAQTQVDSICFCCCGCVSCFWKSLRIACSTPGAPPHRRPPRRRALRSPSPSSDPSPPPRIPPRTCESPVRFPRPRSIGNPFLFKSLKSLRS